MDDLIKVLFVDDNRQLVAAWERLITQQPDMRFVGALRSAEGLVAKALSCGPDVILVDLTMAGPDPLGAVAQLSKECPSVCTLIYSGHSRDEWADRVVDAGAAGFIDKGEDPATILDLIRQIIRDHQRRV
jgi:two-component system invasion response regulator UvrY